MVIVDGVYVWGGGEEGLWSLLMVCMCGVGVRKGCGHC